MGGFGGIFWRPGLPGALSRGGVAFIWTPATAGPGRTVSDLSNYIPGITLFTSARPWIIRYSIHFTSISTWPSTPYAPLRVRKRTARTFWHEPAMRWW